jgi:flavin-dependent dehydrogenase
LSGHAYDAVIVGASFAGLAAARRLGENVAIVDRKPIGSGQTSSCGAPLATIELLGAAESILQLHDTIVIHTQRAERPLPFREPFCTFDYRALCEIVARQVPGRLLRANVNGLEGQQVSTTDGLITGRVLVDASGWRAALGSLLQPHFTDGFALFCGVETEVPMREQGLHFWIEPSGWRQILGWVFPCGEFCRVGVGSYVGSHPLGARLDDFLAQFGVRGGTRHGGFLPGALRPPTVGHVFVVGDAAGHCVPLSGEGIRPSLFFADACGRILGDVVSDKSSFLQAIENYRRVVQSHRWSFGVMKQLQDLVLALPPMAQDLLVRTVSLAPVRETLEWAYDRAIPSAPLRL